MKTTKAALALAGALALLVASGAGGTAQAAGRAVLVKSVPNSTVKVALPNSFASKATATQATPIVLTLPTFPVLPDTPIFARARAQLEAARQRLLARLQTTCDRLNSRGFDCTVSPS